LDKFSNQSFYAQLQTGKVFNVKWLQFRFLSESTISIIGDGSRWIEKVADQ
jgi:hypothetical protein